MPKAQSIEFPADEHAAAPGQEQAAAPSRPGQEPACRTCCKTPVPPVPPHRIRRKTSVPPSRGPRRVPTRPKQSPITLNRRYEKIPSTVPRSRSLRCRNEDRDTKTKRPPGNRVTFSFKGE